MKGSLSNEEFIELCTKVAEYNKLIKEQNKNENKGKRNNKRLFSCKDRRG